MKEYIKFNIDEHNQAHVFCVYKEIKDGVKSQTVSRAYPINLIGDKEPKILEMVEGEIVSIYYEQSGSRVLASEVNTLEDTTPLSDEDIKYAIDMVKKCCIDMAYDDLLKPPSIDEQVEDFIKEFFENEDTETIKQDDFLANFFEEEAAEEPQQDVVSEHFKTVEEKPLEERDFLAEFFTELEEEKQDSSK